MKNTKKILITVLAVLLCLGILGGCCVLCINAAVKQSAKAHILSPEEAAALDGVDCILVLGCGVWDNGQPSHMLEDRLKQAVALFDLGAAPKLLMTGDHGRELYDEVNVMKQYAVSAGIASCDVFMDHAGFSTYESMVRAKEIFQAKKVIIVTQEYHLYRAVYIARQLGLDAYGVASDYRRYAGETGRQLRETLARVKDFGACILRPDPTYLGEVIPIWGDGDISNDENSNFT